MSGTLDYSNYSKCTMSRNCARNGGNTYLYDHTPAPFHPSLLMRFNGHRQRIFCVDLQQSLMTSSYVNSVQKSVNAVNAKHNRFSTTDEWRDRR